MTEREREHFFPTNLDAYTITQSEYSTKKLTQRDYMGEEYEIAQKVKQVSEGKVVLEGGSIQCSNPTFRKFMDISMYCALFGAPAYGYFEHDSSILWAFIWLCIGSVIYSILEWLLENGANVVYKIHNGHYGRKENSVYDNITLFKTDELTLIVDEYKKNSKTEEGRNFLLGKYNPYQLHFLKLYTTPKEQREETWQEKKEREEREKIIDKGKKRLDNMDIEEKELF
ncbi:MAG: hypothetical protein E7202_10980 [Selenomonas ruminantium]|jgi:hypothetical protein|nr:hypothetical protein [Selenomonas ruminantium]